MNGIICGTYPGEAISPDVRETAKRLGVPAYSALDDADRYVDLVRNASSCAFSAVVTDVKLGGYGMIDLGFGEFCSFGLEKILSGCGKAFVFGVTLGIGVDRLLMRYENVSSAKHFILDAAASAFCEALCDTVDSSLRSELSPGLVCVPRFSPGYGDLSLAVQPGILGMICAGRTLGITLNDALLMTPRKSITAIMGIKNEK